MAATHDRRNGMTTLTPPATSRPRPLDRVRRALPRRLRPRHPSWTRQRVVVVGGGFGGLYATLHLARQPVDVVLVDRRNFHLFQPLAYQVATGGLTPAEIARPLRSALRRHPNVRVMLAEVTGFDLGRRRILIAPSAGGGDVPRELPYDVLVVAGGSRYSYFGHDEWRPNAPELKSLEGALDIRARVLGAFEAAEWEDDPERRAAWLTFVVVGGGPTGVEMAGQIAEVARDARRDFRVAHTSETRVLLVEARERVLAGFPERLSRKAEQALHALGVSPLLGHVVTQMGADGVTIRTPEGGDMAVHARTAVWAAGVQASPLAGALAEAAGGETDRAGRIVVEPDLTVPGHPEVMAIGDMVAIRAPGGSRALPGLAPVAMQQGRYAARAIAVRRDGGRPAAFRYRDKGNMATIGRLNAVAEVRGVQLSGAPAWFFWLGVHLAYLAGFQNRLLVLTRWTFSFLSHGRGARLITAEPSPAERAA
jgi:NADH:ubiquinone reductase (H+-translocating)